MALDSTYPTPVVLLAFSRLYRGHFEAADSLIRRAERLRERMAPSDRAMLDHLDGLLRADGGASLRHAQAYWRATPGSAESPLLVVSIAMATGKPRYALTVLEHVDPDRGLNLAGGLYWRYKSVALLDLGRYDDALKFTETGLRRFPNEVAFRRLKGQILIRQGRTAEAMDLIEGVPVSRPRTRAWLANHFATVLNAHGQATEADRVAAKWQPRPDPSGQLSAGQQMDRIELLVARRRWTEAQAALTALMAHPDAPGWQNLASHAGVIEVHLGDSAEARRIEARAAATREKYDHGLSKVIQARIAAHLGDRERAVGLLQQARTEGYGLRTPGTPFLYDPLLLPLHGFAPFEELIEPKG